MQKCFYADRVGCTECTFSNYKLCPKFVRARIQDLTKDLLPFEYTDTKYKQSVLWSSNRDLIKSIAAKRSVELNLKVVSLSLNQVINYTIVNSEVERAVYYIECCTKVYGDVDKVSNVLNSFVDMCRYAGCCVFIYKSLGVSLDVSGIVKI